MKAAQVLFWKEIGESAKWAAMGALALAIGLAYAAYHAVDGMDDANILSLVWSGINMTMALGAPMMGVGLACLQILPERTRDRWAFFIHRPADRFALFAGKGVAGISLLLAATVIPFVGASLWASTPGHIAGPFDWGMTEAGFADIAVGIVFYFAGLLAAVRPACWYGSRLIPIPAAIVCAVLCSVVPEFWQALAITVLFGVVLGSAAWDSFRMESGDHFGKLAGRSSLGATLAVGIALTGFVVVAVLVSAWQAVQPPHLESTGLAWTSTPQTTEDGQVVRERRKIVAGIVMADVVGLGDVNYNPISVGDPQKWLASHPLFDMQDIDTRLRPVSERLPRYDETARYATVVDTQFYGHMDDPIIRYVRDGLITLYSERSRTLVGAIGTHGYRSAHTDLEATQAGPFSVNIDAIVNLPSIIAAQDAIYSIGATALSPMLTGTDAGQARDISMVQVDVHSKPMTLIVIATSTAFHIFGGPWQTVTLPRHYNTDLYNSVSLGVTGSGRFVLCYQHGAGGARATAPSYIEVYDNDGNRLSGHSVAAESATGWASIEHTETSSTERLNGFLDGIVAPAVIVPVEGALSLVNNSPEARDSAAKTVGSLWFLPFLAGSAIAGLICALITWRIARCCAFGRGLTWAWVIGNVFLSWIGVLVMIALRPIPVREPCDGCGIPRVVTREACEHCGSSWPALKRDGTEIFDEPSERVRLAV
jgi:hypothetical protein